MRSFCSALRNRSARFTVWRTLNRLVFRIADLFQIALDAFRLARLANAPSVPDELMRKEDPAILRNDFHQIGFDFLGICIFRQIQAAGNPLHVRIDNDPGCNSKRSSQHHVRSLPSHAGKREDFLHRSRHLAVTFLHDFLARTDDGFCFVMVKAGRTDFLLDIVRIRVGERRWSRILLEKTGRNHIHALIGGLRRENRRDQKLKRIVMLQCSRRCGIGFVKPAQNRLHTLRIGCAPERAAAWRSLGGSRSSRKVACLARVRLFLGSSPLLLFSFAVWISHRAQNYSIATLLYGFVPPGEVAESSALSYFLFSSFIPFTSFIIDAAMSTDSIRTVGVLGAGTMGNGIAHVFARRGYHVILRDVEKRFLDRGLENIPQNLEREAKKGKLTEA